MGTSMGLVAHGPAAPDAIASAKLLILELESLLSRTLPGSDISTLNSSRGGWVSVHRHTEAVLTEALDAARRTHSAYDPAVGTLVDLWSVGRREACLPSPAEIARAVLASGHGLVQRRACGQYRLMGGATLDLGGIGKGFAADQVHCLLRRREVKSALLTLGGSSVSAIGTRPDGSAWRVGLRDVDGGPTDYFGVVDLVDGFLSTSADYEQFEVRNGRRLHHIIDTRTGWPADSDLRSVTVIADTGTRSETLSTALLVMGLDAAMDLHERDGGFEAVLVTTDGAVLGTPGAPTLFKLRPPAR